MKDCLPRDRPSQMRALFIGPGLAAHSEGRFKSRGIRERKIYFATGINIVRNVLAVCLLKAMEQVTVSARTM